MRRPLLVAWAAGTLVALAALFALRAWPPGDDPSRSLCMLRRTLGVACPTCGMTRAFLELSHGRWSAALRLHPLAPPLAIELAIAWTISGLALVRPGWAPPRRAAVLALLVTLAALLVVWLYRLAAGTLPR